MIYKRPPVFQKIGRGVVETLRHAVFLYVLAGLFVICATDYRRTWNHSLSAALSRYTPTIDFWEAFKNSPQTLPPARLKEFESYYANIVLFLPDMPEGYALAGYSYYYGGHSSSARQSYEKAVALNTHVMSFHYNLGMIAVAQKDYRQALNHFKNSSSVNFMNNFQFVLESRAYIPLRPRFKDMEELAQVMFLKYQKDYEQSYEKLLWMCAEVHDYQQMLIYAKMALSQNFTNTAVLKYYAGLALFELKEYKKAILLLREAINDGFKYAQAFELMGKAQQALDPTENSELPLVAQHLKAQGKVFKPEGNAKLLLY